MTPLVDNAAVAQSRFDRPRVFFRPFKSLIYFQHFMKIVLAELKEAWGSVVDLEDQNKDRPCVETRKVYLERKASGIDDSMANGSDSGRGGNGIAQKTHI